MMDIQSFLPKYFAVMQGHVQKQPPGQLQATAYKIYMNTIYLPSGESPINVIWPVNNVELSSAYFTPLQHELRPVLMRKWNGKTAEPTSWAQCPTNLRILTESEYVTINVVSIQDTTLLPFNGASLTLRAYQEVNPRASGAPSACPPAKIYTTDPHDKPILPPIHRSIHRGATAFELEVDDNEPDVECGGSPSMLKVSPKSDAPRVHQLLPSPIGFRRSNSYFNMHSALPYSPIVPNSTESETHIGVEPTQAHQLQITPHPKMRNSSSLTSLISAATAAATGSVSTITGTALSEGLPMYRPMSFKHISTNYSIPFIA
jgi:hypothetical protein